MTLWKPSKMRILVTTARAPAALELARHLHRAGHEILLADSRVFSIARYSRYSRKYFRVCPPRESAEQYRHDLCDIIRRESVDLLIPVFEETLHIAAGIEQFRELTQVFCDDIGKRLDGLVYGAIDCRAFVKRDFNRRQRG